MSDNVVPLADHRGRAPRLLHQLDEIRAIRNAMRNRARLDLQLFTEMDPDDAESAIYLHRAGALHEYASRIDTVINRIESGARLR
ncbi:hypothetical protein [Gordonia sp. (in: high G+C Gram-positive bacteria)]|uniref:hypothetical protein n=1 Tax=Gordonia sp. (in: high G+C Gram-positive bacteria) TaxID=84139 RepID=UPI0039E40550